MLCSLYFLDTQWHIINSWVHCLPGMVWLSYDSWETTSRLNRCVLNICLAWLQYWLGCGQSSAVCQTRSCRKSCLSVPTRNRAKDNVQGQNIVPSIFSCQMEAIVFIILEIFLVLKTEEYHSDIPQIQLGNILSGDKFLQAKCAEKIFDLRWIINRYIPVILWPTII